MGSDQWELVLLKKDVVSFGKSRLADDQLFALAATYGDYADKILEQANTSGQIVFDLIGDSGASDVRDYPGELNVAQALSEYINGTAGRDRPSFMYHLGDIVYSFGEAKYYFDQFYKSFANYAAPIIAIPGNHDSFIVPGTPDGQTPLEIYARNFCAQSLGFSPDAATLHRTAGQQPGVYFTLDAPFVRIIGLFSNALEDPGVISSEGGRWPNVPDYQLDFLRAQLARIKAETYQGAVLLATHHPCFSYSPRVSHPGTGGSHGGSAGMLADIEALCNEVGVFPHAILSGHVHNYQRFTRSFTFDKAPITVPFIVVGASGHHVNTITRTQRGQPSQEPRFGADASYLDTNSVFGDTVLTLESYEDQNFGYMRVTVTKDTVQFNYYTAGGQDDHDAFDTVTVELASRKVS